jgi:hypothetical protein
MQSGTISRSDSVDLVLKADVTYLTLVADDWRLLCKAGGFPAWHINQRQEEGKDHGAHTQQEMQFKLRVPFLLTRNLSMD